MLQQVVQTIRSGTDARFRSASRADARHSARHRCGKDQKVELRLQLGCLTSFPFLYLDQSQPGQLQSLFQRAIRSGGSNLADERLISLAGTLLRPLSRHVFSMAYGSLLRRPFRTICEGSLQIAMG